MSTLYYRTGKESSPIPQVIEKLQPPTPNWSWYDPRPGTLLKANLKPQDLHPLLRPGHPVFPRDIEVDEVRLFWADGALHLLDTGSGKTRLFWWRWSEEEVDGWEKHPDISPQMPYPVLLKDNKAFKRFGLSVPEIYQNRRLQIVEYWQKSALFAWTIKSVGE